MKILAQLKTFLSLPAAGVALLASLSVAPSLHSQTAYTTWAQSYGVGSYDGQGNPVTGDTYGSGNDTPSACVAMPDGGFVVAGALDLPELYLRNSGGTDHSGSANTAMVRYAADGHILWQQVLRQDNDQYDPLYKVYTFAHNNVSQMLADAQGNLYLRMHKDYLNLNAPSEAVAKFAPDGTLIWQAGYNGDVVGEGADAHGAGPAPFTSMSLTADGGVVISGGENYSSGASQPFYAKINADGSLGAHRPFVNNGQYDNAGAAAQSADGTRFVVGMSAYFPDGTNLYSAVVLLDASNHILAERSFANDAHLGETPAHILANDDGTFTMLSIGAAYGGVYYVPSAYIVRKLAADLTPIWEKVITNISNPCNSLARTSDGGYLLTSVNAGNDVLGGTFGSSNTDLVVLRLNRDGALISSFLLGGTDAEDGQAFYGASAGIPSVTQTADGGFGLAVSSLSYHLPDSINRPDWWVVKADALGRVHGFGGVMSPGVTEYFNAHDNTVASVASNHYSGFPQHYGPNADERYNPAPNFIIEDLGAKTGVNKPTILFQANPSTAPLLSPLTGISVAVQLPAEVDSDYTFDTVDADPEAGLFLRVQYNPTPLLESGWTDLPGGGRMTLGNGSIWTLHTNAVPLTTGDASTTGGLPIAFRAIAAAPGYADGVSDFSVPISVGPSTVPVFIGKSAYTFHAGRSISDIYLLDLFTNIPRNFVALDPLPPGLDIFSGSFIEGTPTQAGTYQTHIQCDDYYNHRKSAPALLTFTILPAPALTSPLTATAIEGKPFSYQITVSNFTPASYGFYSYDFSGLPPGLSFDRTTGLVTGTVDSTVFPGDYRISISATDANNDVSVSDYLTLTIKSSADTGTITSAATASGQVGKIFAYQITADFTPTSYSASGLPDGVTLNSSTGLISGVPGADAADTYAAQVSASDASGHSASLNVTITIAAAPTNAGTADLTLTVADSPDPVVVGGTVRYTFTLINHGPDTATGVQGTFVKDSKMTLVSSASTPGVVVNGNALTFPLPDLASGPTPETFVLAFTADAAGVYTVGAAVQADQTDPHTSDDSLLATTEAKAGSTAAHAPVITAAAGGEIIVGETFKYQITTDGTVPVDTYTVTGLPAGLSVDSSTGLISGTLADGTVTGGSFTVTLRAANGAGASTGTRSFTVVAAPTGPKIIDVTASFGSDTGIKLTANGKYKFTGSLTLSNLGTKAFNGLALPGLPPKPPLNVGLYLSNSPTFSYPLTGDPTAAGLLPLAVTVVPSLDPTTGVVVGYSAKVTVPTAAKPGGLASLAIKLAKGGKNPLTVPFSLKASVSDLPAQVTSGQYRYLLLVLDPNGGIASEASKSNNTAVLDLRTLLGSQ